MKKVIFLVVALAIVILAAPPIVQAGVKAWIYLEVPDSCSYMGTIPDAVQTVTGTEEFRDYVSKYIAYAQMIRSGGYDCEGTHIKIETGSISELP